MFSTLHALSHILLRTVYEIRSVTAPSHRGGTWDLEGYRNLPMAPKPVSVSGWVRYVLAKPDPTLCQGNTCYRRWEKEAPHGHSLWEKDLPFYTFIVQTRGTHSNSGKSLSCTIFKNEQISLFQVTITLEIQETNKIRLSKWRTYEFFYRYYSSYSKFLQVPYFSHLHASAEYSLPSAHSSPAQGPPALSPQLPFPLPK